MMPGKSKKIFEHYIASQKPLPWTIVKDHPNSLFVGNEAMAMNYIRLKLIMSSIMKYFQDNWVVVDVGVYPGTIPKIFKEFFPVNKPYEYYGCGLGFSENFRKSMQDYGISLLESDLDPRLGLFGKLPTSIPLEPEIADLCILTDTIEHFFDPFYMLKEINRICKPEGLILLTTDNLTRIDSALAMLKGKSCNVPLIESSLFYEGDWRPHFREYSKGELFQLLKWAGFEILTHKFYEAEFGVYKAQAGKLHKSKVATGKSILRDFCARSLKAIFPYFRDNQFLIAKKTVPYQDMLKNAPIISNSLEKWIIQRKKFS